MVRQGCCLQGVAGWRQDDPSQPFTVSVQNYISTVSFTCSETRRKQNLHFKKCQEIGLKGQVNGPQVHTKVEMTDSWSFPRSRFSEKGGPERTLCPGREVQTPWRWVSVTHRERIHKAEARDPDNKRGLLHLCTGAGPVIWDPSPKFCFFFFFPFMCIFFSF